MSDLEMRELLESVISDIDTGRIRVLRGRRRVLRAVGGAAMATAIALGAGACMEYAAPAYGVPPVDSGIDAGADAAVEVDGEPFVDYAAPFLPPDEGDQR